MPGDTGQDHWYISLFAVDPNAQRQGYGAALLRWINRCADEAGVPVLLETVGLHNERFYRSSGYTLVATEVLRDETVEPPMMSLSCMTRQPRHLGPRL